MPISKQTIEELVKAAKEECGEDLTFEQAEQVLRNWVGYFSKLAELNYRNNTNDEE